MIANEYLAVRLLSDWLRDQKAALDMQLLALRAETGVKSLSTEAGTVTIATRGASVDCDDDDLAAWIHSLDPDAAPLAPRAKPWAAAAYRKRLAADGDEVVDTVTGEVLPWVRVKPGSEYVTAKVGDGQRQDAYRRASSLMAWALRKMSPTGTAPGD